MPAFRVPQDLADLDLTLAQVREILDNRRKRKTVQTRMDGLAAKKQIYKTELAAMDAIESELLKPPSDEATE